MALINRACCICGKDFHAGDRVIQVERVYHVGNVHTESTEIGERAHLRCT